MASRYRLADFKMLATGGGSDTATYSERAKARRNPSYSPCSIQQVNRTSLPSRTRWHWTCATAADDQQPRRDYPGTEAWSKFKRNLSEQFKKRLSMVRRSEIQRRWFWNETQEIQPACRGQTRRARCRLRAHGDNISADLGIALQNVDQVKNRDPNPPINLNGSPQRISRRYQRRRPTWPSWCRASRTRVPCRTNELETEDWTQLSGWYRLFANWHGVKRWANRNKSN